VYNIFESSKVCQKENLADFFFQICQTSHLLYLGRPKTIHITYCNVMNGSARAEKLGHFLTSRRWSLWIEPSTKRPGQELPSYDS